MSSSRLIVDASSPQQQPLWIPNLNKLLCTHPSVAGARIALKEAKAPYTGYKIILQNKPEWYAPRVTLTSKVPMMTYSGPKDAPTNPSPESFKLTESFILLEFIADLSLSANLYANDPVQRAQIRVFIDTFSKKFLDQWYCQRQRSGMEFKYSGVSAFQEFLVKQGKGHAS